MSEIKGKKGEETKKKKIATVLPDNVIFEGE